MIVNVGIGECGVSGNAGDIIVTHALASCVAVTAFSPLRKVAGMVHIVLPTCAEGFGDTGMPYYYADTGVPMLLSRLGSQHGCLKSELVIRLFGGAESINKADIFKLGKRNIQTIERILKDMQLAYDSTETGGCMSRTIEMNVLSGAVVIRTQPITI